VINQEIRLSLSRNYIYASSVFYRRGHKINDIRVVVGTTEDHGDDLSYLIKNEVFMSTAVISVQEAMNKEINKNVTELKTLTKV